MILYHGSNQRVTEIDLLKSKLGKDFGRAFYLSSDEEQAIEMARFKADTFGGEIVVNKFLFDESILNKSEINYYQFESYTEEWAHFILSNRNNTEEKPVHDYDIVYGPIANDRIGRQIFNLTSGYIDFQTFVKRIQYPEGITFQWAFCTPLAIKLLKYIE